MKPTIFSAILFFSSCIGATDYGWVLNDDYAEIHARFRAATELADRAIQHPACRSRLAGLPSWPTGRVPTRWVSAWPGHEPSLLARTMWRNGERYDPLPPRIEIHEQVLLRGSTRFAASVLIHELVHAASWTLFEGLDRDEKDDAARENERLAQEIAKVCMENVPTEEE